MRWKERLRGSLTSESSVLDTLKIFVQVYNSGSENFLFRRKKIVRCFVHFMDFSRESGEACAERRSSIHYAFIMRAGKGVLEHLKKRGRGGCEMFGNVEKQRRNKEKAPIFRLVLCGGDEGDRTPYLLNAIVTNHSVWNKYTKNMHDTRSKISEGCPNKPNVLHGVWTDS